MKESKLKLTSIDTTLIAKSMRVTTDESLVRLYSEAIKDLPPVLVAKISNKIHLLDGLHRYLAHKLVGKSSIQCTFAKAKNMEEGLIIAIESNITQGMTLTEPDRIMLANRLLQAGQQKSRIADLLKVSNSTITRWTAEQTKAEEVKRTATVKEALDEGKSLRTIEEETGIPKTTVARIKEKIETPVTVNDTTNFDKIVKQMEQANDNMLNAFRYAKKYQLVIKQGDKQLIVNLGNGLVAKTTSILNEIKIVQE